MIRWLVLLLVFATFGGAVVWALRADTGYVLFNVYGWVIETTVFGFAVAAIALLAGLWFASRLLAGLVTAPSAMREAFADRRRSRARASFVRGMQFMAEGDWKRAEIDLVRRAADHDAPGLNYLFAARAAHAQGADDRGAHYLTLATGQMEDAAPSVALTRAELLSEQGLDDQAIEVLSPMVGTKPRHAAVVQLLARLHERRCDWSALLDLLMRVEKGQCFDPARWSELAQRACSGELVAAAESGRIDTVKACWKDLPGKLRDDAIVERAYVRALVRVNAESDARDRIAKRLHKDWDGELVRLYGQLDGGDPLDQLAVTEQWLRRHGEQTELLLVAGRACRRNQLWGKARSYLEACIAKQPSPEAYLEMARLSQATQQSDAASEFYRRGLEMATDQTAAAPAAS